MTRVRLGGRTTLDDVRRVVVDRSRAVDCLPAAARAALTGPEVSVDLDLVLPDGLRLRARHRLLGRQVVALAGLGGDTPVEVAWFGVRRWAGELSRAVSVGRRPPAGRPTLDLPLDGLPDCRARLRAHVVATRRAGLGGWVLLDDGWRRLEPGSDSVRLVPTAPEGIAADILLEVSGVRP